MSMENRDEMWYLQRKNTIHTAELSGNPTSGVIQ
jgi:hypothetical protein